MYKRIHNLLELFESGVAVFFLVGILGLTVFGFSSLNPRADNIITESVAGVSTDTQQISIETIYNYPRHEVETKNEGSIQHVIIKPKSLEEGNTTIPFIKITNSGTESSTVRLNISLKGYVSDILDILVHDEGSRLYLFNEDLNIDDLLIKVDANSEKLLSLEYVVSENINFPFVVDIEVISLNSN